MQPADITYWTIFLILSPPMIILLGACQILWLLLNLEMSGGFAGESGQSQWSQGIARAGSFLGTHAVLLQREIPWGRCILKIHCEGPFFDYDPRCNDCWCQAILCLPSYSLLAKRWKLWPTLRIVAHICRRADLISSCQRQLLSLAVLSCNETRRTSALFMKTARGFGL